MQRHYRKPPEPYARLIWTLSILTAAIGITVVIIAIHHTHKINKNQKESARLNEQEIAYYQIIEIGFKILGLAETGEYWLNDTNDLAYLNDHKASSDLHKFRKIIFNHIEYLENKQTILRSMFIKEFNISTKEYGEHFNKKYPERTIIPDEIKSTIRLLNHKYAFEVAHHLGQKHQEYLKDPNQLTRINSLELLQRYRTDYILSKAPVLIDITLKEVSKIQTIRSLYKKIHYQNITIKSNTIATNGQNKVTKEDINTSP